MIFPLGAHVYRRMGEKLVVEVMLFLLILLHASYQIKLSWAAVITLDFLTQKGCPRLSLLPRSAASACFLSPLSVRQRK